MKLDSNLDPCDEREKTSKGTYLSKYKCQYYGIFDCDSSFFSTLFKRQMHTGHTFCKDLICDNYIKWGRQNCIEAENLCTTEAKLRLFKLNCYYFKMLIVIPRVTTKKIILKYTEKEIRME